MVVPTLCGCKPPSTGTASIVMANGAMTSNNKMKKRAWIHGQYWGEAAHENARHRQLSCQWYNEVQW
jgi:hypothetical protein